MAVTGYWFTRGISQAFGGVSAAEAPLVDWMSDSASIKVALMDSSYTPSQTANDFWNDVSAYDTDAVQAVTGYAAGGKTFSAATTLYNTAGSGKTITFDAPDIVWTTATLSASFAVLYKDSGTTSTSPLLAYLDFGANVPAVAGDFTISWNAGGISTITVA